MSQHILVISQCFYPEQFRINDICKEWVRRGYKITVLTGIPNYPQGKFYDGYGWFHPKKEEWEGMEIIRIPLISRGKSSIRMVLNYLSFPISGYIWNLITRIKADKVFMFETSPMTQCMIGVWYAKKHKVPLYLYAQDLWPQNVEVVTGIHHPLVIKPIQKMVNKIYHACTDIFVTSESFVKEVVKCGIPKEKVHYWPQYAEDCYQQAEKTENTEVPDDGRFNIVFTGNIGYAQGLDILPKTAELLTCDGIRDVRFVMVGEGRYQDKFMEEIRTVKDMFLMLPRRPAEEIPKILASCHVAFLSFQDNDLWKMTIPAKLQSYMSCAMPILASAEGEAKWIIEEAQCGISTPLGDANRLAEAVKTMREMSPAQLKELGTNAKQYSQSHFDKQVLLNEMDQYIGEKKGMKILMINVVCGIKSTGRICTNIAEELEKEGHEVRIAYGREEVPEKYQKYAVRIGSDTDVKLHGLKARLSDSSGFGSKKATKKFIKWVKEYDPDIIHMHNLHGYYLNIEEWFEYLRTCGKKILWTLHDCWAFSGHSAHCSFNGCERWITGCHDCPNMKLYPAAIKDRSAENWLLKKQLMDRIPNMTIITPSKWLAGEVKKSFLAQYPVHVINNGIDTSVFRPHESTFKKDHGIEDKIMVLAVSTEWTILKGYPDYLKLAKELGEDCKLVLVGLTKELCETLPKNIIGIERTNSIQELADIYSAADVFINLSYCETYPTVDLEAIACGTPVVTYAVGGGMEIVTEDAGKIVAKGNLNEVKRAILDLGIKKQPLKTDTSCMDNKETVKHYLEHIC